MWRGHSCPRLLTFHRGGASRSVFFCNEGLHAGYNGVEGANSMDQISALAVLVDQKLTAGNQFSPGKELIREVLQVVYTTSMKKEESEPLRYSVVYLDPATKNTAKAPGADTWNAFALASSIPFDARNLAKIAQSADPGSVVLAVFPNETGKLFIWGFVDQVAVHSSRLASWETTRAQGPPGSFHVIVNGVADITVYHALNILAALKQDALIERYDDVLNVGPVSEYIQGLSTRHVPQVLSQFSEPPEDVATDTFTGLLQAALSRTLLNIQR